MSLPNPATLYEEYERELAGLLEQVLAGDLVEDWAALERLVVRVVGGSAAAAAGIAPRGRAGPVLLLLAGFPAVVVAVAETHHLHGE